MLVLTAETCASPRITQPGMTVDDVAPRLELQSIVSRGAVDRTRHGSRLLEAILAALSLQAVQRGPVRERLARLLDHVGSGAVGWALDGGSP